MNKGRILQLEQFLQEDENDYFSIYALALEHKEEMPEKAIKYLEDLSRKNPNYLALYYHLAELYIEVESIDLAKKTFEKGIDVIAQTTDHHSLKELRNAYQNFQFEYE